MAHIKQPGTSGEPNGEPTHVDPGGEVHGRGVRAQSAAVHHEVTDIPLGGLTRAAVISVGVISGVMLLMWATWGFFLSQAHLSDPGKPAMAAQDFGQRLPGTPRLQSVPETDLTGYRAQQAAKLEGLDWVDQSAGTVRIPIRAAMQLIVTRAAAFADPQAKMPADHSWSEPGPAQMDRAAAPAAAPTSDHAAPAHAAPAHGAAPAPATPRPATPPAPPHE